MIAVSPLRKNILFAFFLKAINILCSLVTVPLTLTYLNGERYGLWLTISSILLWFTTFDMGLGNGFRNALAESWAKGRKQEARAYVSTTLLLLTLLAVGLLLIFFLLNSLIDYSSFFKTTTLSSQELRNVVGVAVGVTLVNFVVKNVGVIFIAVQKYAINDLLVVLGNGLALILIYIQTKTLSPSLLNVTLAFTCSPVVVYAIAAFYTFRSYPELTPSLKETDFSLARRIIGNGLIFFFIQITSCLVIFGSSNIFIMRTCGAEAVTDYNIAYKYFNVLVIGYTIIVAPLWSAYTEAKARGEWGRIRNYYRRSLLFLLLFTAVGLLMLLISPWVYRLWVGELAVVPHTISVCVLLYISLFNLNNCTTNLLNGLNILRVQLLTSVIATVAYLAMVRYCGQTWGVEGISLLMSAAYLLMAAVHLYQCHLLLTNRAKGLWVK